MKLRICSLLVCPLICAGLMFAQDAAKSEDTPRSEMVSVPAGPSLAEGEIIILLQAKVPLDLIQKFVSVRGVNFVSSKEASKKIITAGGNVALIGTINLNQKDDVAPSADLLSSNKKKK
jgi:ribosomal protein L18E